MADQLKSTGNRFTDILLGTAASHEAGARMRRDCAAWVEEARAAVPMPVEVENMLTSLFYDKERRRSDGD